MLPGLALALLPLALGLAEAFGVGLNEGRLRRSRLTSGLRSVVRLGVAEVETLDAGAGYAIWACSPGQVAAATAAPVTATNAAGTTTLARRTARIGRSARRGRGRAKILHSPELD